MPYRAFTLFEVLVALAILSAGVGAAVLASRDFNDRRLLVAASNSLLESLRFARSYALLSQHAVTLCASVDGKRCRQDTTDGGFEKGWIIFAEPSHSANATRDANEVILSAHHALHHRLRVKARNITRHIRFLPTGKAHRAGRIALCLPGGRYQFAVVITTTGLIRPSVADNLCAT